MKILKVTQMRSGIGFDRKQRLALRGLGLRRIRHAVDVPDTKAIARTDPAGAAPRPGGRSLAWDLTDD